MLIIHILIALVAFVLMEGVAWFTHKYVMHGFLWSLHRSHHRPRHGWFEQNDFFSLFFAGVAMLLIYIGFEEMNGWFWAGVGVTGYGAAYFIFHDVIVHRRLKVSYKAGSDYMKRIIRAHKIHHKTTSKHGASYFGFLYAPLDAHRNSRNKTTS